LSYTFTEPGIYTARLTLHGPAYQYNQTDILPLAPAVYEAQIEVLQPSLIVPTATPDWWEQPIPDPPGGVATGDLSLIERLAFVAALIAGAFMLIVMIAVLPHRLRFVLFFSALILIALLVTMTLTNSRADRSNSTPQPTANLEGSN
jgi:hypothetical protein